MISITFREVEDMSNQFTVHAGPVWLGHLIEFYDRSGRVWTSQVATPDRDNGSFDSATCNGPDRLKVRHELVGHLLDMISGQSQADADNARVGLVSDFQLEIRCKREGK